jgi:hypothetical protein
LCGTWCLPIWCQFRHVYPLGAVWKGVGLNVECGLSSSSWKIGLAWEPSNMSSPLMLSQLTFRMMECLVMNAFSQI